MTYSSDEVKAVLDASYLRVVLDVNEHTETTSLFNPDAIPVCVVLNAEGAEQGRFEGFAEAEEHATWLKSFVDE
ncbi:MAG: hypothetical protein ACYTDT_10130 [Planctomycetota bacterium]